MDAFLKQFQHLKIQLEEIKSATNNFDDQKYYIGEGGFGKVYRGEVTHYKGRSMVAIKRLDSQNGQGTPEFLKEITTLSRYTHENLISLLGFCYQEDEMILVYELASRGSLDSILNSPHLTWRQRLKICIDAAKGLSYLHDPRETHQRLIHCDVKSANILLDDQWNAKVSDFGLSIMGSANEENSVVVTVAAGTSGYCDPEYGMTHTLTKESDVYSFGVVLFEVLCGRLCRTYKNGHVQHDFVPKWIKSYEQKELNEIIFKSSPTIQPLDQTALEIFSDIAYRCLKDSREDRPKMAEVVTKLEGALEIQELIESQEFNEWRTHLFYYQEIIKSAQPPLKYRSEVELMMLLCKGVLLNLGKTWFSLTKKGEHCEMISITDCLRRSELGWYHEKSSRFPTNRFIYRGLTLETNVKTQFLSPGTTYTVNLVFKFGPDVRTKRCHPIFFKYKLQGETEYSISYLADEREDGWWMCELYQFTSDHRVVDLQILFEDCSFPGGRALLFEGIEFWPLEEVEHTDEKQPLLDLDANWEEKLPNDYKDIMKWSKNCVQWTTKKEAYSIICKGFLINDGKEWISIDKNGKKCYMLSAGMACAENMTYPLSLSESRFGEAVHCEDGIIDIYSEIQSQLVSSETTYGIYLVYKLQKDQSGFLAPLEVTDVMQDHICYIYLVSPQTPVIRPKADQNTHKPLNRTKVKDIPQQRNDGWMEVRISEFQSSLTIEMIRVRLILRSCDKKNKCSAVIVEGFEFRPL